MTEKEITCKYKFRDRYHYNGNNPYCTLFNERCKDLDFICDKNCQVFEDYKKLRRKTAECEELKEQLEKNRKLTLEYISYGEKYLKALDEIENFAKRHCNTCEDNGQQLCSSNYCYRHYLLDIINNAKGVENE